MNIVVGIVDTAGDVVDDAAAVVDDDTAVVVVSVDVGLVGIDDWSNRIDDHRPENEMGYEIVMRGKDIGFAEMKNPLELLLLEDR